MLRFMLTSRYSEEMKWRCCCQAHTASCQAQLSPFINRIDGTAQLDLQIDNILFANSKDRDLSWRPPADQLMTLLLPLNSGQPLKQVRSVGLARLHWERTAPNACYKRSAHIFQQRQRQAAPK